MAALFIKPENGKAALDGYGQTQTAKPLVLVVEDHEDTLFMLTYLLGMRGCCVEVAADGEEALRVASRSRPNLILMDISLPRLDGLEATRRLRGMESLKHVPVVFLSGHAEQDFRAAALAEGGDDYLVKPFALTELERLLDRHIGKSVAATAEQSMGFES